MKDGVVTRGILFDATRLPGKATPQGWLEPGTAIHREDLEALEKIQRVKVSPGDVILLYTGRWKRRAALGPWPNATGFAGYHIDVAYFLKERGVSFIGADGPNDVSPSGLPQGVGLHQLALVAMGVSIFDNLDFERAVEEARRVESLRVPVHGRAAPHREGHGIAAQSAGDFLDANTRDGEPSLVPGVDREQLGPGHAARGEVVPLAATRVTPRIIATAWRSPLVRASVPTRSPLISEKEGWASCFAAATHDCNATSR